MLMGSGDSQAKEFFAGRQIRLITPGSQAGAYALYGQLAAQHLGRFIPGNPTIFTSNMPGAAGLNAMNYLYEIAPRDGTVIAVMSQDLASQQALGTNAVLYDAMRFNYIGRLTANVPAHMVWHTAPAKSIAELKTREVITAATGTGGDQNDLPRASNALIGTRWKIISGYRGNSETRVALERGEVQASITAATLFNKQLKPWLLDGKVKVVVQYADFRHPTLPNVPTIVEVAESREAKDVFKFLVSLATVGRSLAAPPGLPVEAIAILRSAFQAMVNDPAFKADAEKRGADILAMPGEELAAFINGVVMTPPAIVRKSKEAIRVN
jgi:tripartite-type tricarboxylate transporter receptor subunit TctC